MAIYSLHHTPIGKSTQTDPYTASAHVAYISRTRALHHLEAARMPEVAEEAAAWLREEENRDRANARVADKVMLALPRELSPEARIALVRRFAEQVTQGRAPWLAAFHDNTVDAHNPHCHLVLRDRDPQTRRRVMKLSEKGSTERLRQAWEEATNEALQEAGVGQRIDRRTLEAQGIGRAPTIHEGVRARRMATDGRRPRSRNRTVRNGRGARRRTRVVEYERIDAGRSRGDYNRAVRQRESAAELWAAVDADSRAREMSALRRIHLPDPERGREDDSPPTEPQASGQGAGRTARLTAEEQRALLQKRFAEYQARAVRERVERQREADRETEPDD